MARKRKKVNRADIRVRHRIEDFLAGERESPLVCTKWSMKRRYEEKYQIRPVYVPDVQNEPKLGIFCIKYA